MRRISELAIRTGPKEHKMTVNGHFCKQIISVCTDGKVKLWSPLWMFCSTKY